MAAFTENVFFCYSIIFYQRNFHFPMPTPSTPSPLLLPPALQKGDVIGLVAPAGPILHEDHFLDGVRLLRHLGFQLRFHRDNWEGQGYLAANDVDRAREFNEMWGDPEVKALLAARGGYGCLRMVDGIDMDLVRSRPKIFIGFSDITVLLAAIHRQTGLVTFHGPMVSTLPRSDRGSIDAFTQLLSARTPDRIMVDRDAGRKIEVLSPGRARGTLTVGNLASLVHLLDTPYEPAWQDRILVLEDVGEPPYRIDRMLTHLHRAGRLQQLAGLILGTFAGYDDPAERTSGEDCWQRVLELLSDRKIPIWGNFPVGHTARNHILPLGVEAEMDSSTRTLQLLGPCTAS
jgi:muramoyltetrapeptide carboxypeptidase